MEVILVLNGTLNRRWGFERHPPKVQTDEWGFEGFSIEYEWLVDCHPSVILKYASHVDLNAVKEIENLEG